MSVKGGGGGGKGSKKIISAPRASVWSKNKGGGGGPPTPLPWIRHCCIDSFRERQENAVNFTLSQLIFLCYCIQFRSLGGNPFKCDCNLEWLRGRLLGSYRHFPRLLHIETIKCASPANLEGRTLVNLSKDVLCGKDSFYEVCHKSFLI